MIKTIDLTKEFITSDVRTAALKGINIQIAKGEFVAIMGPSGCGKSTLLNILGMLDNPTTGQYHFNGYEVSTLREKDRTQIRKGHIGFVFQSFNLIEELTIQENIELPLLYLKTSTSERKKKASQLLEKFNLAHRAKFFPQQLSGGQQQKVAIARAIICNPSLILADEPTGNLDSINGDEVMTTLANLNQEGATIIMVTHSPGYAEKANRIINLFDGSVVVENVKHMKLYGMMQV